MIVMKFGGTSFSDLTAWHRAISIVKTKAAQETVIVASAIRGITDELAACADNAAQGNKRELQNGFERIASTHFEFCDSLRLGKQIRQQIGLGLRDLKLCLESVITLNELTLRTRDQILAYGEVFSSILLTAVLQKLGVDAVFVDSREIVVTDDRFSRARPQVEISKNQTRERLIPLLRNKRIPVLPGFIGATRTGQTTTLGRGGSDFSASLIAGWLQVDELQIWKDVPGFMTADPNVVPDAQTISFLSYEDAEQLCRYGAKILHPLAVRYAARKRIPIRILYTRNPEERGTLISSDGLLRSPEVIGIAAQKHTGRVIVIGDGLRHPLIAAQILKSCRGVQILRISQDTLRSRMILVTAQGDTERAIRQIHAGVKTMNFEV
ncbi:aspartate kinase [bacterium]|nr:aspartate kinase [bacterium]